MVNPLKKATVKADGKEVRVYELEKSGTYCNYDDMKIQYKEAELTIGETIPEEEI